MNKELKETFDFLEENRKKMTDGQIRFVASLLKYYRRTKELTSKQAHILYEIKSVVELRE